MRYIKIHFYKLKYKLIKLLEKLTKKESVKSLYKDLTPSDNIKGQEYFDALDWALANEKIHNIALSGPYGAGKSSVIDTYLLKRKDIVPLRVSLASFKTINNTVEDGIDGKQSDDEKDIHKNEVRRGEQIITEDIITEGLLKQFFYKVDYKRIPQSRYRKLHKTSIFTISIRLITFVLMLLVGLAVFKNEVIMETLEKLYTYGEPYGLNCSQSVFLAVVIFIIWIIVISSGLRWVSAHIGTTEVALGNKAKISTSMSESQNVFNKYLDEIVYFFEATDYELIVFEDIDRFENQNIFIRLRELNRIVNNCDTIHRHIVFLYAIKDDFFDAATTRTKFFDFIIPVIPYINTTNSDNLLRRRINDIKESGLKIEISDDFITQISEHISDMRVLTSIVNEFVLYKTALCDGDEKKTGLSDEKMMALMVFKNICPKHFADIESEDGIIKEAFEKKTEYIDKLCAEKELCIKKLVEGIEEKDFQDTNSALIKLKLIWFYQLSGDRGTVKNIQTNGMSYDAKTILQDDFDMKELQSEKIVVYPMDFNGASVGNVTIKSDDDRMFINGKNIIEQCEIVKETFCDIQSKIEQYRQEIYDIRAMKLKDLIEKYGKGVLSNEDSFFAENELLVFLLRNGYIDETYANYINYFHPDSITDGEHKFVLNVHNHGGVHDFEEEIPHTKRVIQKLIAHEFRQKEVLNFSIVKYIFENIPDSDKSSELLRLLSSRETEVKEFIRRYIQKFENSKIFVEKISKCNPYLWTDIVADETLKKEVKTDFLDIILKWAEIDSIVAMDETDAGCISRFMELDKDILFKLRSCGDKKLARIIQCLDVKFAELNLDGISSEIVDIIFSERKFILNQDMTRSFTKYKAPELLERLVHSNYSVLLEIGDSSVLSYIADDYSEYFENVLFKEENNSETEQAIIQLAKTVEFNQDYVQAIVDSQITVFRSIRFIEECDSEVIRGFVDYLIEKGKMDISWDIFEIYRANYGVSELIFDLVQDNIDKLCSMKEELDDEIISELLLYSWNEDKLRIFVKRHPMEDFSVDVEKIPEKNISVLIDECYIPFDSTLLAEINNVYPNQIISYIISGKDKFMELIEDIDLSSLPMNKLICRDEFSIEERVKLLLMVSPEDIDLGVALVVKNIVGLIPKEYIIIAWDLLKDEDKYQLLVNHLDTFENRDLPNLFMKLAPVYHALGTRKRHKVMLADTQYNRELIAKLEKKKYVTPPKFEEKETAGGPPLFLPVKNKYITTWVKEVKK